MSEKLLGLVLVASMSLGSCRRDEQGELHNIGDGELHNIGDALRLRRLRSPARASNGESTKIVAIVAANDEMTKTVPSL